MSPPITAPPIATYRTPVSQSYEIRIDRDDAARYPFLRNFPEPVFRTQELVRELAGWGEGWNGYDVAAPNPLAVERAYDWVAVLYSDVLLTSKRWTDPHVSASEEGDVVLEWWNKDKGLTFYISPKSVDFVRDWGPDILEEMEDGPVLNSEDRRRLWNWLTD